MPHLKRYSMPRFWPLAKKGKIFAIKPMPGPHPKDNCIPLQILIRDVLKYAENAKEAKNIIDSGKVLVDKKERKEVKFPVGLMDVIEFPNTNKYFRVIVDSRGLALESIEQKDAGKKLCRINEKTTIKGGVCQLNLHDGKNMLVKKDVYKVGDSVVISLPDQKILKHYEFERGKPATIIAGRNMGVKGKIKDIGEKENMLEKAIVVLDTKHGEIQTLRDYILVGEV
jgi:small subunit ribosomal protein S4e